MKFPAPHASLSSSGLYYSPKKHQNRRRSETGILDLPTTKHNYWQLTNNINLLRQISVWGSIRGTSEVSLLVGYNAASLDNRLLTLQGNMTPSSYCPTNTVISHKKWIFKFLTFYEAWPCESPVAIPYGHSVLFTCNNANFSNLDLFNIALSMR